MLYNIIFLSVDFRERNAVVAQKWAALSEDTRKDWALKAEAVCSAAIQVGVVYYPKSRIYSCSIGFAVATACSHGDGAAATSEPTPQSRPQS